MLLIIGCGEAGHIGRYLASAAASLHVDHDLMDIAGAEGRNSLVQAFYWRLREKRPAHLHRFANEVLETCRKRNPGIVLTTGSRVPLKSLHIETLRRAGVRVVNYSTDDPWNPNLSAPWFIETLPAYDVVFTPRQRNIGDFKRCGVRNICYMPFGYDPEVHKPGRAGHKNPDRELLLQQSDVLFVGGCDADRLPLISALADAGFRLALFGGYWNEHAATRRFARGIASQDAIREATSLAAINLCLVRRANRDDHVMRSFEAAAIGGCIIAEDTPDHRDLFGPDNFAVRYFTTVNDLVSCAKELAGDKARREEMALRLADRMAARSDRYADRLMTMLKVAQSDIPQNAN